MTRRLRSRNIYNFLVGLSIICLLLMLFELESTEVQSAGTTLTEMDLRNQSYPRSRIVYITIAYHDNTTSTRRPPSVLPQTAYVNQDTNSSTPITGGASADNRALWWAEQAKRRHTLRQTCRRYRHFGEKRNLSELIKTRNKARFQSFIVDDKHRLLYTWSTKVDSANWMSAFLVLKGKYKSAEDVPLEEAEENNLVKLSSFPREGIRKRLTRYANFVMVAHPFVRLLSAYRNQLEDPRSDYYQTHVGIQIITKYRKNATVHALKAGNDVTFHEFVRYLLNTKHTDLDYNWRPMYSTILPCTVLFDYIGKLETRENDTKYILQETRLDHVVHFRSTERNPSHIDETTFNSYYSQIPSADLLKLYELFKPDFKLFGYRKPKSMNSALNGL